MECGIYTISKYLKGKVRNINVPDEALLSILADNDLAPDTEYTEVSTEKKELCVADLYAWVALSPTSSSRVSDKDAHWEHSEGGETMSASVLNSYMRIANSIYKRYGKPMVGASKWGMVGRGFHDIRNGRDRNL